MAGRDAKKYYLNIMKKTRENESRKDNCMNCRAQKRKDYLTRLLSIQIIFESLYIKYCKAICAKKHFQKIILSVIRVSSF